MSAVQAARVERGKMNYYAGLSAERQVADLYRRDGRSITAQRWRGQSGELDLIAREGDGIVFIEVKRASTHERAVTRLSRRQMDRLYASANEYLARTPRSPMAFVRFDVALVDDYGRIKIIANAFGHDYSGW